MMRLLASYRLLLCSTSHIDDAVAGLQNVFRFENGNVQKHTWFVFAGQEHGPIMISQRRHSFDRCNSIIRGLDVLKAAPLALLFAVNGFFIDANKKFATSGVGKCRHRFRKAGWISLNRLQIYVVTFFDLKDAVRFRSAYLAFVNFLGHKWNLP